MNTFSQSTARAYRVRVEFQSGGDTFATETFALLAIDAFDAERLARARAMDSAFYNDRVPNLGLQVQVIPDDSPDPDGDPPPSVPGRLGAACPRCLSSDVVNDAWASWDETLQRWVLGGVHAVETCQNCGMERDDLSVWLALPSMVSVGPSPVDGVDSEAYRAAVAALPDVMGRAYYLHCAEGLTYAEIADRLGNSIGEVERLLAGALAALMRHFPNPKLHGPGARR